MLAIEEAFGFQCKDARITLLTTPFIVGSGAAAAVLPAPSVGRTSPDRVVVSVSDGLVTDVSGIPPGVEVEVRDYDCTDESEEADENREYDSTVYEHSPEPQQ